MYVLFSSPIQYLISSGGVDYDPGQYFITIPAGMANASFNISISPDNLLEGNEAFLLIIDKTSVTTVLILDNSSLVVIIDDDRKNPKLLHHWFIICIQLSC